MQDGKVIFTMYLKTVVQVSIRNVHQVIKFYFGHIPEGPSFCFHWKSCFQCCVWTSVATI